ncbi:MAG: enoyl-CoA hydratase-related protein [Deltaproteobacteria bacterium]|nr:enoyl-CoA hydratase-related protein [Deltaproteobacteria bacterium]
MNDGIEIKKDRNIAEIILNRKETFNAFNLEMVRHLAKHLAVMAVDNSVRGVIITGNEPSFCAGGDLRWAASFSEKPGISAKQAWKWGLVTKVVEDGSSLEESVTLIQQLAANISLHSFGWSKRLMNDAFNNSFESHLEWKREGLCDCSESADGPEGLKAFIEKRKPIFSENAVRHIGNRLKSETDGSDAGQ